jgi:hypothetical protein
MLSTGLKYPKMLIAIFLEGAAARWGQALFGKLAMHGLLS